MLWGITHALVVTLGGEPITDTLIAVGAKVDAFVSEGQWWRLVRASILHADIEHLLMNTLWAGGLALAAAPLATGRRTFATMGLGAMVGHLASWIAQMGPSVGASGAVYAALGLVTLRLWRARDRLPAALRQRTLLAAAVVAGALIALPALEPGIDHAAHLGGLACGLIMGRLPPSQRLDGVLTAATIALFCVAWWP